MPITLLRQGGFLVHPSAAVASTSPFDSVSGLTGAWSMSRKLLSAYAGSFYSTEGNSTLHTLFNQTTHSGRDFNDVTTATVTTSAGPNSRAALVGDGTQGARTGSALSNFISSVAGYIIISGIIDTYTSSAQILMDGSSAIGIVITSTALLTVASYNRDGDGADVADTFGPTAGDPFVWEWRHEGNAIYARFNASDPTEAIAASSNTTTLADSLRLFGDSILFTGKVFELVTYNTIPSTPDQNTLASNMVTWVGA